MDQSYWNRCIICRFFLSLPSIFLFWSCLPPISLQMLLSLSLFLSLQLSHLSLSPTLTSLSLFRSPSLSLPLTHTHHTHIYIYTFATPLSPSHTHNHSQMHADMFYHIKNQKYSCILSFFHRHLHIICSTIYWFVHFIFSFLFCDFQDLKRWLPPYVLRISSN